MVKSNNNISGCRKKRQESIHSRISRILRVAMIESDINNLKELSVAAGIAYDRLWREMTGKNDWFLRDLFQCCEALSLSDDQRAALLSSGTKR